MRAVGKDDAGVQRVFAAERMGMAAAAVASTSARIGDARSVWDTGVLSVVNSLAERVGRQGWNDIQRICRSAAGSEIIALSRLYFRLMAELNPGLNAKPLSLRLRRCTKRL